MRAPCCSYTLLVAVSLLAASFAGCGPDENSESQRADAYYHLDGSSSGLLADFKDVSCAVHPAGTPTYGAPHIAVQFSLVDYGQAGKLDSFINIYLDPLPSPERVRGASVVLATASDSDNELSIFQFSLVAAEYEYGVPVEDFASLWLHKITIPEQTFNHSRNGEITLSGSLDGLYVTCFQ
ncbi:MAG: hypothetical protein ACQEVA_06115 [Myxococcota bacterium]